MYEQLEKLREYLQYRIDEREYTEKMAAAKLNFEEFRRNHVEDALRKFDRAEKERDEELKWSWSPLYQLFKKWPLQNFRPGPWDHSEAEWLEMSAVLVENTKSEPHSLQQECPHIVRAFLQLIRTLEGFTRPLSHPTRGLCLQYILQLTQDTNHSVALTRIAQNIPITGWSTFPDIQNAVEGFDILFADVAALLGYEPSGQMGVVQKIESFIGRIAQRAVADMIRLHRESELADMWYTGDIGKQRQSKCEEVWRAPYSARFFHHFSMSFPFLKNEVLHVLQIHWFTYMVHIGGTCSTKCIG